MPGWLQLGLYTGQQLVLEGLHRLLQRPCHEAEQHRQRRNGLRSLVVLLVKTAATGVLATVLDAAIEYRRRQLLAAASAELEAEAEPRSRFAPLGLLSRAGISAWKGRLLVCIDELERQAGQYGIESRRRYAGEGKVLAGGKAAGGAAGEGEAGGEERRRTLAKTVEQLRSLVEAGGSEERLKQEVDSLLDSLLGEEEEVPETSPSSSPGPQPDIPAPRRSGGAPGMAAAASSSSAALAELGAGPGEGCCGEAKAEAEFDASDAPADGLAAAANCLCQICMDRQVKLQVEGCRHEFCFQCARRLCSTQEQQVPQCPFCRQAINGFSAC